jgi:hypothetical protein
MRRRACDDGQQGLCPIDPRAPTPREAPHVRRPLRLQKTWRAQQLEGGRRAVFAPTLLARFLLDRSA